MGQNQWKFVLNILKIIKMRIKINGTYHEVEARDIVIKVFVGDKIIESVPSGVVKIEFKGDLASLDCTEAVVTGNVNGDVDCTSITCNNVNGNVDCTSITCNNIDGDINSRNVTVTCNKINGDVDAMKVVVMEK